MDVYRQRRTTGGHLGKVYQKVLKSAKKFADSTFGKGLADASKKAILDAGSSAVNDIISGAPVSSTIKGTASKLVSELPSAAKKTLKRVILSKASKSKKPRKKLGGALLYKLNQRRRKEAQLLYRLRKKVQKKRSRKKSVARYKLRSTGRRRTKRRRASKKGRAGKRRKRGPKRKKKAGKRKGKRKVLRKKKSKKGNCGKWQSSNEKKTRNSK